MSNLWWLILLIFAIAVAYWYLTVPKGLPPGSAGVPVLGYMPFVSAEINKTFAQLGRKFGKIFHVYLGNRLVIVLNDFEAAKEAFIKQGDVFAGRPHDIMFRETDDDNCGVIATDGELWKHHRRFILSNLRDSGVGKLILEPQILNEIHCFLAEIEKHKELPFSIKDLLVCSLANNIQILLTGKRFDYVHPITTEIVDLTKTFEEVSIGGLYLMFLPWLKYVPGADYFLKRTFTRSIIIKFIAVVNSIIADVKTSYTDGEKDHYVQAYLTEQNSRKLNNSTETDQIFTDLRLLHNARDLLSAGSDTSATTLQWALLYLTNYPEVQKKIQKEIDEVVGRNREPSYNDRINMPYTEATICEVNRIVSLVPLSLPHRNIKETTLFNYRIPKDTLIFVNLWNIHHDLEIWGDPENFRPDRFINENGQLIKSEYLVPFSIGKRACAGEPLARMELFLYLVSLLQRFDFVPPEGIYQSLDGHPGVVHQPKSDTICAKLRFADSNINK